jgi:hypothetical protein
VVLWSWIWEVDPVLFADAIRGGGVLGCLLPWPAVVARREAAAERLLPKLCIDVCLQGAMDLLVQGSFMQNTLCPLSMS